MVGELMLTNVLLLIFVGLPVAVVLTGIISGVVYVLYQLIKDSFSNMLHMHHKGAH